MEVLKMSSRIRVPPIVVEVQRAFVPAGSPRPATVKSRMVDIRPFYCSFSTAEERRCFPKQAEGRRRFIR